MRCNYTADTAFAVDTPQLLRSFTAITPHMQPHAQQVAAGVPPHELQLQLPQPPKPHSGGVPSHAIDLGNNRMTSNKSALNRLPKSTECLRLRTLTRPGSLPYLLEQLY